MPNCPLSAPALRNQFLARLPKDYLCRLSPLLQPVELKVDQVLYQSYGPIEYAYFPTGAVLSALVVMQDGGTIEVATVGCEGLVGHYGFGGETSPHRVIAQIGGDGYRLPARVLQEEANQGHALSSLLAAYHIAFMAQVSQSVACNGLHGLEQRCCRWLLMSRDRVQSDHLRLSQEYLAAMLGARRASVTDALKPLQEAGLVSSRRGVIRVLDGAGLEARACECYAIVRDRYAELLGNAL